MACAFPFKGFWSGNYTENGKKEYIICPSTSGDLLNVKHAGKKGFHVSPSADLVMKGNNVFIQNPIAIPCGSCVNCRVDRAKDWKIRCCLEALDYPDDQVNFVTLTYRDSHLPHMHGQLALSVEDLRGFFMNLRRPSYGVKREFRYYACGEYGSEENTARPHYHVILYGPLYDLVPYVFGKYRSATLERAWPHGLVTVERAVPGSIAYVCGYVEKKQVDQFKEYPVQPFTRMSDKPMIGHSAIELLTGSPDRKVYGQFGNVNHARIPRSFLRKCEDSPWFTDYKNRSEELAKDCLKAALAAAGTYDQERLGSVMESSAYSRLEKVRKVSL